MNDTGSGVVDFHNHVIPGVDDGARDAENAREALAAMALDGVRALIATPHVDASIAARPERLAARMAELDAGWARLEQILPDFPQLEVRRGAEVKLDSPDPDLADARFRLGGGSHVLVEFPYFTIPPRSSRVIVHLRNAGWTPIIAHPERYGGLQLDLEVVQEWRAAGALLQMNGPSLTGRYGDEARSTAFKLLEKGWADYLSSDYHARGRPDITAYRQALIDLGGDEQATVLTEVNPGRLLRGEMPLPVAPIALRKGFWGRITSSFR